jgi:plastocyanin
VGEPVPSAGVTPGASASVAPSDAASGTPSATVSASGAKGDTAGKDGGTNASEKPSGEKSPPDMQQGGPKTVVIMVNGRTVNPKPGSVKVKRGEEVLLVVITDHDSELHVHGVDVEKETTAGEPTQVPLTFDETGSYEVELHEPELLLTKFVVS